MATVLILLVLNVLAVRWQTGACDRLILSGDVVDPALPADAWEGLGAGDTPERTMSSPGRLVLDTHILLYWLGRDHRLSAEQASLISEVSAEEPLWVASISLWEIATLLSRGRLRLKRPLRDWLEAAVAPPLVCRIGMSPAIAAEVAQLPDTFPRDPADRIIVATTRVLGGRLLTQDQRIIASGLVPTVP